MKYNENCAIKYMFYIFIIFAFVLFITTNSKSIVEGFNDDCNDCRITPGVGNPYIAQSSQSSINTDKLGSFFSDCTQLSISGSDISYVFCPWEVGYNSQLLDCSPNTVTGSNDISYCCKNSSFYKSNYLEDTNPTSDVSNIPQYGIIFKYTLESSKNVTNPNFPDNQPDKSNFNSDIYENNYKFIPISNNHKPPSSLFNDRFSYNTTINASSANKLSGNTTKFENSYITCNGDISTLTQGSIGYITPACLSHMYKTKISGNSSKTVYDAYNYCLLNNASTCDPSVVFISSDGSKCTVLLPSGDSWMNSQNSGLTPSPDDGFTMSNDVKSSMQNAVSQLVDSFTQQINSLTNTINDKLQFPNIGTAQYLDIGACDNNSPYVYNSSCDNSMGYLQNYTCYPSVTGAFSDCGPPAYEPKPQFY